MYTLSYEVLCIIMPYKKLAMKGGTVECLITKPDSE